MIAKAIQNGPICRIKLKHHVPYGFHACFVPFASTPSQQSAPSSSSSQISGASLVPHPLSPLILSGNMMPGGADASSSSSSSSSSHRYSPGRSGSTSAPAASSCVVM
jgi:hypothetical protein